MTKKVKSAPKYQPIFPYKKVFLRYKLRFYTENAQCAASGRRGYPKAARYALVEIFPSISASHGIVSNFRTFVNPFFHDFDNSRCLPPNGKSRTQV